MYKRSFLFFALISLSSFCWADVPAPPVNQLLGLPDVGAGEYSEAECRACHDTGVPDRHHLLYGTTINPENDRSAMPYPEYNTDGVYNCLVCHNANFTAERDCTVCHTRSPHHQIGTVAAETGECVACHGDYVDNMDDGHYIPTYAPSLVTPAPADGAGEPLNSRGNGAGACNYCHDSDDLDPNVIRSSRSLHHGTGLAHAGRCDWCHDFEGPENEQIRRCEGCHGPESLHNIQADSPNPENIGTLVVGFEDPGYGHVGNNDDCWGCHGFAQATAPNSGPIIPTVYATDSPVITAGTASTLIIDGTAFTNIAGANMFESDVSLTAADGTSVTLTPDVILEHESMSVTIPADTAPGNYKLRAVKPGGEFTSVTSNPVAISIVPKVAITKASAVRGVVTITGSGFSGYAKGSGTSVTGSTTTSTFGAPNKKTEARIISWSETKIKADFGSRPPKEVTVRSVYGTETIAVSRIKTATKSRK